MKSYTIHYDPDDSFKLCVNGQDVSRLRNELHAVLKSPGYKKFEIKITDLSLSTTDFPNLSSWIKFRSPTRCSLAESNQLRSVIELILTGHDWRRQRKEWCDYFGATTAHAFLSTEQQERLMCSSLSLEDVWNEILIKYWDKKWFMHVFEHPSVDITNPPLPSFRYWFRVGLEDDYTLMSDIAIFRLDSNQLKTDKWLHKDSPTSAQYGRRTSEGAVIDSPNQDTSEIFELQNGQDVMKLVKYGRRIICAGRTGKLVKPPFIEEAGFILGSHIAFVLDNNER